MELILDQSSKEEKSERKIIGDTSLSHRLCSLPKLILLSNHLLLIRIWYQKKKKKTRKRMLILIKKQLLYPSSFSKKDNFFSFLFHFWFITHPFDLWIIQWEINLYYPLSISLCALPKYSSFNLAKFFTFPYTRMILQ